MIITVLLHFQIIKVRLSLAVSVAQGYQSVADGASFEVIMMLLIATIYRVTTLSVPGTWCFFLSSTQQGLLSLFDIRGNCGPVIMQLVSCKAQT